MAEGEELKTNNELTIRPIRAFCDQLQLALGGQACKLPDYARYDDARIGFAGMEESSPPAIREKASLMVSAVFVAAM
jgi:hypothetical protein